MFYNNVLFLRKLNIKFDSIITTILPTNRIWQNYEIEREVLFENLQCDKKK